VQAVESLTAERNPNPRYLGGHDSMAAWLFELFQEWGQLQENYLT